MTVAAKQVPRVRAGVPWHRQKHIRQLAGKTIALILLLGLGALFLAPVLWMLAAALKSNQDVFNPSWIPDHPLWNNFTDAWNADIFGIYLRNTAIVAALSVSGVVISSSLVAYAFARLRWPGRDIWFLVVLATMLLPSIVTFIPQYILFSKINWTDTWLPLIVPSWFGNAFFIFLLRQFYRGIPMDLSDAARIDGASELRIWWQIIMPLSRPALAAVGILAFTGVWEDYFNPLIYLNDPSKFTLQLGLQVFESTGGGGVPQWNYLMAVGLLIMLPIIVIFFIGQRYFIEGVTLTGLKG